MSLSNTLILDMLFIKQLKIVSFVSAHRNEHLAASLRSFYNDLKAKDPQSERKRKKALGKRDRPTRDVLHISDS